MSDRHFPNSPANPVVFGNFGHPDHYQNGQEPYSPGEEVTQDDRTRDLFGGLDGVTVECGREQWQVEVTGVHAAGTDRWIQIALEGPSSEHLVVRVTATATAADALEAIGRWLHAPSHTERLVKVG